MKKILFLFTILSLHSFTSVSQIKHREDVFVIKMDDKMSFKKVKDHEILYVTLQHKRFKVKHIYLFKVDRENILQVKKKNGEIIRFVNLTKKEVNTRGELRRTKPPILDQILKNKEHLLLMHFKNFDIQYYWKLEYLGSTVER